MSIPQKHNLDALLVGTAEFRFCQGATSAADTKLKGWRDFGNIVAFTPETDVKLERHEGSYRGKKIVDKKFATSEMLEYVLTVDEHKKSNLKLLFMAVDGNGHTQTMKAAAKGDSMAFTMGSPADTNLNYDIYVGGSPIIAITALTIRAGNVSVTADATTDKITETAHGRSDGDTVIFDGTAVPTGLTAGTVYYVVSSSTNDYKVSATSGGAAIDLTGAGTAVVVGDGLVNGTDFTLDATLGSIQFAAAQSVTCYPYVTAPAIAEGDANHFYGIIPMQETEVTGYGDLVVYDQDDSNNVVYRHKLFSCVVTAEKSKAIDGKKVTEFDVRVSVTADPGELQFRDDLND